MRPQAVGDGNTGTIRQIQEQCPCEVRFHNAAVELVFPVPAAQYIAVHEEYLFAVQVYYSLILHNTASGQFLERGGQHQFPVATDEIKPAALCRAIPEFPDNLRIRRRAVVIAHPELLKKVAEDVSGRGIPRRAAHETGKQLQFFGTDRAEVQVGNKKGLVHAAAR